MILTGAEIQNQVKLGRIVMSPFREEQVTTNSYDLCLGDTYLRYRSGIFDTRKKAEYDLFPIPKDGLQLEAGDFVLAGTAEVFGSNHYVPLIHARSGIARAGLFVHVTADLIDIGSIGNSTLQLFATLPIRLYAGLKIAQVTFWQPQGDIRLYTGKYQNSSGPMPSLIYSDSTGG